ncbi:hypothetical protein ADK41_10945 [Streptomyces caelestis]|uniref:Uncharacterized protein n=1 Tax=Streptomyces caelestis TaxID=36816 RepID=A0A0M8QRS5_9ACTN|nr:hypothetical protein ADK41_10945 [Streptomyces caelestis]
MDHPARAERVTAGAVAVVEAGGPRQTGAQREGAAQGLLLRLRPVRVPAAGDGGAPVRSGYAPLVSRAMPRGRAHGATPVAAVTTHRAVSLVVLMRAS